MRQANSHAFSPPHSAVPSPTTFSGRTTIWWIFGFPAHPRMQGYVWFFRHKSFSPHSGSSVGPEQCSSPTQDSPPIQEPKSTYDSFNTSPFQPHSESAVVRKDPLIREHKSTYDSLATVVFTLILNLQWYGKAQSDVLLPPRTSHPSENHEYVWFSRNKSFSPLILNLR